MISLLCTADHDIIFADCLPVTYRKPMRPSYSEIVLFVPFRFPRSPSMSFVRLRMWRFRADRIARILFYMIGFRLQPTSLIWCLPRGIRAFSHRVNPFVNAFQMPTAHPLGLEIAVVRLRLGGTQLEAFSSTAHFVVPTVLEA